MARDLTGNLTAHKDRLDKEYEKDAKVSSRAPLQEYDPDAFDSMAVINSEVWNTGHEETPSIEEVLPTGLENLSLEERQDAALQAAEKGSLEAIKALYQTFGSSILKVHDEDQYTPLHRASYNGHVDIVKYLVNQGADIEAKTVDGWRPLHSACRWNKVEAASALIQAGALINSQTNGGQTPLHLASSNERAKETLELLLSQLELELGVFNMQGETAFQVAERSGPYSQLFLMADPSVDYRKFLRN